MNADLAVTVRRDGVVFSVINRANRQAPVFFYELVCERSGFEQNKVGDQVCDFFLLRTRSE